MRVAFFGGTFDPPHRGHLAVARAAAEKFALDQVLFAPTARQPLKPDGATANFEDRLAMVKLLCDAENASSTCECFVPSRLDAPREDGKSNYTIDTLKQLRAELDRQHVGKEQAQVFAILGADAFLDLRRWREPDALLQAAEWIVVSRPGFSLGDLAPLALTVEQQKRVHLLEGVHEPVSASEVRDRLESGSDSSSFLTPEVLAYIREHGLYLSH